MPSAIYDEYEKVSLLGARERCPGLRRYTHYFVALFLLVTMMCVIKPGMSGEILGKKREEPTLPLNNFKNPRQKCRDDVEYCAAILTICTPFRIDDPEIGFKATLRSWYKNLVWMKEPGRTLFVLFESSELGMQYLRNLVSEEAPDWNIELLPFRYDPSWQTEKYTGGGGGGAYINFVLAHEIYFSYPILDGYQYLMRFDDDITVLEPSSFDIFEDMHKNDIMVGWKQHIMDNDVALNSKVVPETISYVGDATLPGEMVSDPSGQFQFPLSDVWGIVHDKSNPANHHENGLIWRNWLVAGCVEMYNLDIFRNVHYKAFVSRQTVTDGLRGIPDHKNKYWEQELKTLWMQIFVPLQKWKSYSCFLSVQHKRHDINHWFFNYCDYKTNARQSRGHCTLDPDPEQMRIC